jgi:microcystin-dependent protein
MELYISTIIEMAVYWTPRGLQPCDGRKLQIRGNEALFSLIGIGHGGDGRNDFALPDERPVDSNGVKRDWKPNEIKKFIVVEGIYPPRD